jgi:hypothetical protein
VPTVCKEDLSLTSAGVSFAVLLFVVALGPAIQSLNRLNHSVIVEGGLVRASLRMLNSAALISASGNEPDKVHGRFIATRSK